MNTLDQQYQNLLRDILDNGTVKKTRNGGTISVFGRSIRYKFKDGKFPLLTSKKMATKQIITELLWFLRGETNIQSLVKDGNNIWVGDAYKAFFKKATDIKDAYTSGDLIGSQSHIDAMFSNSDKLVILSRKEFIDKIKTDDDFAQSWGELGPVYGKQWRRWSGVDVKMPKKSKIPMGVRVGHIDQIANVIETLKTNPDDRRMIVSAWNPSDIDSAVLPPCHFVFQFWTRELDAFEREDWYAKNNNYSAEQRLEMHPNHSDDDVHLKMDKESVPRRAVSLMFNMRSCDVPLGLPFNIASYGALLQIIAGMVNMVPDELISSLGDTHVYLNQTEGVKEQLERTSYDLPQLKINRLSEIEDPSELKYEDFELLNYVSEDRIKFELSN